MNPIIEIIEPSAVNESAKILVVLLHSFTMVFWSLSHAERGKSLQLQDF